MGDIVTGRKMYLPCSEASGNPVDATGNCTGITKSTANVLNVPGKYGNGLQFQGPGAVGNVTVPAYNTALNSALFTIAAWVYPHSWGSFLTTIICKEESVPPYTGLSFYGNGAGKVVGSATFDGVTYGVTSLANLAINTWTHLALAYNNSSLKLYVNAGTPVVDGAMAGDPQSTSTAPLCIGTNALNDPTGRTFTGIVDEIYYFDRALVTGDLVDLMAADPNPAITTEPRRSKAKQAAVIHKLRTLGKVR